jgi:hypothetical protein
MFSICVPLLLAFFAFGFARRVCADVNTLQISKLRNGRKRQLQALGHVDSLVLINVDTNLPIINLTNGMIINTVNQNTSNFNIRVTISNGTVGSIKFSCNGKRISKTETRQPFSFCGNSKNIYNSCTALGVGQHTVSATTFSDKWANGTQSSPFQVTFKITAPPQVRFELVSNPYLNFLSNYPS